jgi:hypothetical protein
MLQNPGLPARASDAARGLFSPARHAAFWFDDIGPLSGPKRFVFYAGLLAIALLDADSPLHAPELAGHTAPELWTASGLWAFLGLGQWPKEWLALVRVGTVAAWASAAVGLFGRPARVLTALGVFALAGANAGAMGIAHRWHVPLITLIIVALIRTRDRWSVDFRLAALATRLGWRETAPEPSHGTGFPLKLLLVVVTGLFFSAGIAKLLEAGPAWLDGSTICGSASPQGRSPTLSRILAQHAWACSGLAAASLLFELGAPLALLSRNLRFVFVITAWLFHLGIASVMYPAYFGAMWCYLLFLEMPAFRRAGASQTPRPIVASTATKRRTGVALSGLMVVVILGVALLRVEWWPVSHIPMYSFHGKLMLAARQDPELAQKVASECVDGEQARVAACALQPRCRVNVFLPDGQDFVVAVKSKRPRDRDGVTGKQWSALMRETVILDLATKPPGRIEQCDGCPAEQFLRRIKPWVERRLDTSLAGMRLGCRFGSDHLVLASIAF